MMKTYKLFLALLVATIGNLSASAAEEYIPLTPDMFFSWDGWDANAQKTGQADCLYVLGESTGQPFGDPSVINYADLSV